MKIWIEPISVLEDTPKNTGLVIVFSETGQSQPGYYACGEWHAPGGEVISPRVTGWAPFPVLQPAPITLPELVDGLVKNFREKRRACPRRMRPHHSAGGAK